MRKDHRRQIAMQRDWIWQHSRTRQKARKRSRGVRLFFVALLALVIIIACVSIVVVQHAGLSVSRGAATPSAQNAIPTVGAQGTQDSATSQVRTGVFSLSDGGPIPVPANVLKPVNIARTILNGEIYSIYAGALARQPEVGALAILQENIQSGQQSLHTYQSPRSQGALTILSLQQNQVIFATANGGQGRFDLFTDQFQLT